MALISGRHAMVRVLDALGLTGQSVDRLVIVCDVKDVTRIYVRRTAHEDEIDALADALIEPAPQEVSLAMVGGLEVDEKGRVFVPAKDVDRMMRALAMVHGDNRLPPSVRKAAQDALGIG